MWNPDGSGRHAPVNLSTASASSSSALLTSIRAQRQAREELRAREHAATTIQRVWRGRQSAAQTHEQILQSLESGQVTSVEKGARSLLLLLSTGGQRERVGQVLDQWCAAAVVDVSGTPMFATSFQSPGYLAVLPLVMARILRFVSGAPRTALAARLLTSLEAMLSPSAYVSLTPADRADFVNVLAQQRWVETLDTTLQILVAASPPKKKNPLLVPVVRLIVAPLALSPATATSPMVQPLLQLLAIPALLTSIPLASLTHLSSTLPLFSVLLPAAGGNPALLSQGSLNSDLGRAAFLANLATFGITGGMLARHGARGAADWIRVVGIVLGGLGEGWGRWAENRKPTEELPPIDSDDEAPRRALAPAVDIPPNVSTKLLLLAAPAHLSTLAGFVVNGPPSLLQDYSAFVLGILHAFRGSPRWEGTLDSVMEGKRGRALLKLLWREGVRGRWSSGREAWDSFSKNPSKPALVLLSQLYCHYLLLTPDDEFFAPQVNPLSIDEVLDLSSIWRDLAYWGYMHGVGPGTTAIGTEEQRSLFTRGVTRLSERNARRKFAADEFWIMQTLQADPKGFIEAVKFEAAEFDAVEPGHENPQPQWGARYTTRRQIAYISPRLGLLNNLPMAVPFQTRLEVFRQFIKADRERLGITSRYDPRHVRHRATIRRSDLAHDGFRQLNDVGPLLKGTIEITFVDQWGQEEAGIDGGGLFKEFLTSLNKEAFDTERGLWLTNYNNELYPNPHQYATEPHQLAWYGFIGRVLGKALYEDILVDVSFAGFFLAKWLGRQSYLDDLASLDRDLYRGLILLKNYPEPEELSLNFTVTEEDFGVARSVDLVPGGSDIAVTADNRHEYIQLVCRYKLDKQFSLQSRSFFAGLSDLIDPKWLRMFDQTELAQLLGGEETPIDLVDLREHTNVTGFESGYTPQLFWRVVSTFTQEQQRALLRFVTSCSRPPLLGFKHLNPGFAIRNSGADTERLPTASSCANLLKLPDYKDEKLLRTKLLQAITSGAGFDMS